MTLRPSRSATIALLLSPVGIVLISATRILIIADYSPATASTIVSSGGYVDAVLGTVIPLVPVFMPYLALILLLFNRVVVSLLTFLAAAFVSSTPMTLEGVLSFMRKDVQESLNWVQGHLLITVLLGVPSLVLLLAEVLDRGFYASLKTAAAFASLALLPLVFAIYPLPLSNANNYYSGLLRQPWLPAVRITLHSGRDVIGYVLSSGDKWVVVLLAESRTVRYLHADNVARQTVCQIGGPETARPLVSLVATVPQVPTCETVARPVPGDGKRPAPRLLSPAGGGPRPVR